VNHGHSGSDELDSAQMPTSRRAILIASGASLLALLGPHGIEAADVSSENRAGKRRKRQRRRLRHMKPPFRDSSLKVVNRTAGTLQATFYYRIETGIDTFGRAVANGTHAISANGEHTDAPGKIRIGVLIHNVDPGTDLYADVRNVPYWYPRGGVSTGQNLDPAAERYGDVYIAEQNFDQREERRKRRIALKRLADTDTINWELTIGSGTL
jgi:hypothetical protein